MGVAGRRGGAPLNPRVAGAVVGLAFFGAPVALVAAAVSARTSGVVDAWQTVRARVELYAEEARVAARSERVPLDLVLAVACVESAGRPRARSGAGAVGLMQLLPSTAAELAADRGEPEPVLTDPATSLRLGARYLRRQLDAFAGHPRADELALCAYNAGPGAVRRWIDDEPAPEDEGDFLAWVRFRETRDFVRRVAVWRARWREAASRTP